jgi:phosphate transport system substrate-binding protein
MMTRKHKGFLLAAACAVLLTMAACGGTSDRQPENRQSEHQGTDNEAKELGGRIVLNGSSTVYPIALAVAEEFMNAYPNVNVLVASTGSSNGIKAIINGEADIANASRTIKDTELEAIRENGDDVVTMPVAYDGITVVIHPKNDWARQMTVEQLNMIWRRDSNVKYWSDVDPAWPKEKINLYGPGTASGTFEYFTEAINGEAKVSRTDYIPSEDDNVLVQGVSNDPYALGYFGYSYFIDNKDRLQAVAIKPEGGDEYVYPTMETINDGSYVPLSREIYMYPLKSALERPEVKKFIEFYMSEKGQELVESVGYVRLPQEKYDENLSYVR